jgi:hypothetical protein
MVKKTPDPTDKHVGSRVRMRRMVLGISQEKLDDSLDVTFQQVHRRPPYRETELCSRSFVTAHRRSVMPDNKPNESSVRDRAHHLWEVEGKPEGKDKEHWHQAEKELSSASPGEDRTPEKKIGEVKYAEVNSTGKK